MMEPDIPVGHSMDTAFFAIDRDGHVALFDTGEAGAVPVNAYADDTIDFAGLSSLPLVEVIHDRQGRLTPGRPGTWNEHHGSISHNYPIVMFLDSVEPVRDEIAAGRAVEVRASEGVAVLFRQLPEAVAERLHTSGACRGCSWYFEAMAEEGTRLDPAAHGIFSYSHLTENWISGPYGRVRQPAQPIHVDQLPPRVRDAIKAVRFDTLSFTDTPHIQPVEHTPCESWESAYLDVTGKHIRAIPGKEAEYAQAYEELAEIGGEDDVRVEPPDGQAPNAPEE
jgi:hypothetical protein